MKCGGMPIHSRGRSNADATSSILSPSFWNDRPTVRRAAANTTRCLIGCSLGDLSALWLLQGYWPELGLPLIVACSCAAGITTSLVLETVVLRWTECMMWGRAWRTAAGMSFISMLTMELAETTVELALTGGAPCHICTVTGPTLRYICIGTGLAPWLHLHRVRLVLVRPCLTGVLVLVLA